VSFTGSEKKEIGEVYVSNIGERSVMCITKMKRSIWTILRVVLEGTLWRRLVVRVEVEVLGSRALLLILA
jgi:hypothetical protein